VTELKGYERRYTGKQGKVAHLVDESYLTRIMDGWLVVLCGLGGDMWKGTGSQDEYERAEALPLCRNCLSHIHH
jgi:hypothetical protein